MEALFCDENMSHVIDIPAVNKNIDIEPMVDEVLVKDRRVVDNMLSLEKSYPVMDYCERLQTEIAPHMRKIVTDWMLEVCQDQQSQPEVFFLAVNYLDRFLSSVNIKKNQFQLLASVCILLASKFSQVVPITSEQLVVYTDHSVTVQEMRKWEIFILEVLQWELSTSTPNSFLQHFFNNYNVDDRVRKQAEALATEAATEYKFLLAKDSVIAASALAAAVKEELKSEEVLNIIDNISNIINCNIDDIFICMVHMMDSNEHLELDTKKKDLIEGERPTTPDDVLNISQSEIIV